MSPQTLSLAQRLVSFTVLLVLSLFTPLGIIAAPPVLDLPLTVGGNANSPFSWQISATNSPTFYTASGLPPGLVLNRLTGLISGTPKISGGYAVTIAAGNADGTSFVPSGGGARQITVFSIGAGTAPAGPTPQISSGDWVPYVELLLGQAFSRSIQATQTDATTRYVLSGTLPPGITIEGSTLSGTPTQSGLFIAEVVVTNLHGFARLPVVLFVPSTGSETAPVLTAPEAITVDPYTPTELFLTADRPVSEYVCGPLPRGLFLDSRHGRISGRLTEAGTWSIIASARDHEGTWAQPVVMTIQVNDVPAFSTYSSFNPATIERGVAVPYISLPSSEGPSTRSISDLPPGVTFVPPSTLTGTPTEAGFFTPLVTFTNSGGSTSRQVPMVVMNPAFEKPSADPLGSPLGIAFGAGRFVRVGPSGLIETSADNGVTWTAASSGTTTTLYKIAYGGGRFVAAGSGVVLTSPDGLAWTTPVTLPAAGTPISVACADEGIIILTATRIFTSSDGLSWTNTGTMSPITPAAGADFYQGDYAVYGSSSVTSIMVSSDGITWTGPVTLPNNIYTDLGIGQAGDQYLRSSFNKPLESSPDGTTWVSRGTTADFSSINAFAHGNGYTLFIARKSSTPLLLRNPGAWATDVNDPGTRYAVRGQPFSLQLTASETPIGFHAHGLPPGLSLNPTTGLISGTPLLNGTHAVTIASVNALGHSRARSFSIHIENDVSPPPFIGGSNDIGGSVGQPFSYDPSVAIGVPPTALFAPVMTYQVNGLPPGVSIDAQTGKLSGAPSLPGTYVIDYLISGQFDEIRHRVTARITTEFTTTISVGTGTSYSSGLWYSGGKYALELTPGSVVFSDDGETWGSPVAVPTGSETLNGFAVGEGKYVLSSTSAVYSSTDLAIWTKHALPAPSGYRELMFAAGRFVLLYGNANSPAILSSLDGETWSTSPLVLPPTSSPYSVAFGNGVFVATTSQLGPVLVSSNGVDWLSVNTSPALDGPVAFANGRFAIMSGGGATSTDGLTWQSQPFTIESPLNPKAIMSFGQGFLVTTHDEDILGSLDGQNWRKLFTHQSSLSIQALTVGPEGAFLRYRNGYAVLVDRIPGRWIFPESGPARFSILAGASFQKAFATLHAEPGLSWHATGLPGGLSIDNAGVVSGTVGEPGTYQAQIWAEDAQGLYVPLDLSFDVRAATGAAPALHGLPSLPDATFADTYSTVLRLRSSGINTSTTLTGLPDGLVYDPATLTISGKPTLAGSFDVHFTATDSYGHAEWTLPLRVRNGNLTAVASVGPHGYAWDGVRYVAVSGGNLSETPATRGTIDISSDGITWTRSLQDTYDTPLSALYGVVWAANKFVAVGSAGTVLTSIDGTQWQRTTLDASIHLRAVVHANGRWVAVGSNGVAATSIDAVTWQVADTGTPATLNSIVHDGTAFFTFGYNGTIRRSTDGTTWTAVTSGTTNTLYAAAQGAGRFVVGTTNRNVLVSTNGVNWSPKSLGYPSNSSSSTRSVAYKAGYGFVLNIYDHTTGNNRLLHSPDGLVWTPLAGYGGSAQNVFVSDDLILISSSNNDIRVFPAFPAPEIAAATSVVAYPGAAFHYDVAPWGLQTPLAAQGLPAGLTLDPNTGTITGTVQTEGIHQVTITSAGAQPARHVFKLSVLAGPPTALAGSDGLLELRLVRGDAVDWPVPILHPAESWRLPPNGPKLPAGLSLNLDTGRIVGTANESGGFLHQFYAVNALGETPLSLVVYVVDPPAVISRQPSDQVVGAGGTAVFSVEAGLTANARFQWFFNGEPLAESASTIGTKSATLQLTNVQADDVGGYDVIVSDGLRTELSSSATLTVTAPASYAAWFDGHSDTLGSGALQDAPLGDGVSNLLRYALGLPIEPVTTADYLITEVHEDALVLTYVRPSDRSDIHYFVEGSRALQEWSTDEVTHKRAEGDTDEEWETWRATYPLTPQTRGFLRLRVELIEP